MNPESTLLVFNRADVPDGYTGFVTLIEEELAWGYFYCQGAPACGAAYSYGDGYWCQPFYCNHKEFLQILWKSFKDNEPATKAIAAQMLGMKVEQ
jgi:hypothetical protein